MRIRLLYLSLRNIRLVYWIPVLILFVFVPIMIYLNVKAFGINETRPYESIQTLAPIASTWWLFLSFKEYIDGNGIELLYAYLPKRKSKLQDVLLLSVWYLLHAAILHIGLGFWFGGMLWEFIRCAIQCCFFALLYYMLMYLLKSTSISYMAVMVYYFMSKFFARHTIFESINIFSEEPAYPYQLTHTYLIIFAVAVLFGIIGYLMNRQYPRLFKG